MRSFLPLLLLAALAVVLVSCFNDRLDPVAPSWDLDLTVPLANRQYTVQYFADKSPGIVTAGSGNQVIFHRSVAAPGDSVKDAIALNPAPSRRNVKVGAFGLDPIALTADFQFPFLPGGTNVPGIPDTTVTIPDVLDTITTFSSATFESGSFGITISNNIPDSLVIVNDIVFSDSSHVVGTLAFAGVRLGQGGSVTRTLPLAGQTLGRIVSLSGFSFHLLGKASLTLIPIGPLVRASVAMNALRARSAVVANVPPQRLTNNDTTFFSLSDSTIVKDVLFRSGTLNLAFSSGVPITMILVAQFAEIFRPSGAVYLDSVTVPKLGAAQLAVGLKGVRIHSVDGSLVRQLMVISSLVLPVPSGPVTLHDTDKVNVNFTPAGVLVADSAWAVIKPTWIAVNKTVSLNFGDLSKKFSGSWVIPVAGLRLNTLSTIGCPADLFLQLSMRNPRTGVPVVLDIPAAQRRVFPGTTAIVFDSAAVGNFLSSASPVFPDSVRISGNVLVNPVYDPTLAGVSNISYISFVRDTVSLDVPLRLSLTGGIFRDTSSGPSDTKDIDRMNSGVVHFDIQNALPSRVRIGVILLDSMYRPLLSIPQSSVPINVAPATVDGQGLANAVVPTAATVALSGPDVRLFNRAKYAAYQVYLDTTPGSPVRFRTTDFIHFRIWSTLSFRVSK